MLVLTLLLADFADDMSTMLWQVRRRKAAMPGRLDIAKATDSLDLNDQSTLSRCSFLGILQQEAPLIREDLVEVRAFSDATFNKLVMSIHTEDKLDDAGRPANLMSTGLKIFQFTRPGAALCAVWQLVGPDA